MLYVYAIVDAPGNPLPPCLGHDGAALFSVSGDGLAAVCSHHDGDLALEPDEGTLWVHERVVEALLDDRAVLPARFGTTVADEDDLRGLLERRRAALLPALELVRGRREIGVRVLWDPPEPQEAATDPTAGSGTAYLVDRIAQLESGRTRAGALHAALSEQAVAGRHQALATPRLLLSGAYLVDRDEVGTFLHAADELADAHPDVQVICTGPWPAHNFAPEDADAR
jgi:Gas vesicle synthesis protein GvpL/GvpF